jgi:hypothetical protein
MASLGAAGVGALGPWLVGSLPSAGADNPARRPTPEPESRRRERVTAIREGCQYLSKCVGAGGRFGDDKAVVAITALCTLALMAGGSGYNRGPHGEIVGKGIDFLVKLVNTPLSGNEHFRPEGYFYYPKDSDSKMHGQGYAALALAMALGSAPGNAAREIRTALQKAVVLMEKAQTESGGYGYDPHSAQPHEGSVTVCVAQALRAARDCGLLVDQKVVKAGLRYLKRSQVTSSDDQDGAFRYAADHARVSYALTAAAISSFFLYGEYVDDDARTIERGLAYMMRQVDGNRDEQWYYYGHFYGAWAFWQKDGGDWRPGTWWERWQARVYPELLSKRLRDGSWDDNASMGQRYAYGTMLATPFAVLTLAVPDETLPIFQR